MRKRKILYMGMLLAAAILLVPVLAFGQSETLPSSGEWSGQTISDERTVNIDGDIKLNGTITIGSEDGTYASLTINYSGDADSITITRANNNVMFRVYYGSTLTINGKNSKNMIIIDGGADMKWTATDKDWEDQKKKSWEDVKYDGHAYKFIPLDGSEKFNNSMIETNGDLVLENVRIEDFYDKDSEVHHAIHVAFREWLPCGKATLKNCTITRCKSDKGSAIFVGKQTDNNKNNKKSCAVTLENVTIEKCMVTPNHDAADAAWGGIIRFSGASEGSLTMKNCIMKKNYSTGDGSCLWWNAGGSKTSVPELILSGCQFINNRSDRDAGAVRLESGFSFAEQETVFEENSCGRYGGAIQVADYNQPGGDNQVTNLSFNLNQYMTVKNNYAGVAGGGIAFYYIANYLFDGSIFDIHLNGLNVTNNEAAERGGGIIFTDLRTEFTNDYTFNVNMDRGYITNNIAGKAGGGIFAHKFNIRNSYTGPRAIASANIEITGNKVTEADAVEKGGTGGGGGIALYDGTMHLYSCNISYNTVTAKDEKTDDVERGYGGGILINRSEFALAGNDNKILGNEANVGGGVAILNTTPNTNNIQFLSGIIKNNTAHIAGGGAAIVGNTMVTIDGVSITDNFAANGGGLYVRGTTKVEPGTATVTYTGGDIKRNNAIYKDSEAKTPLNGETGRLKEIDKISGMGGGLCVGGRTILAILVRSHESLGIQGNEAVNGGDDVFCNGSESTTVVLPGVASMSTVEGGDRLFWVEDYITNDTEYGNGTCVNENWKSSSENIRYRDAIEKSQMNNVFRLSQKTDYSFSETYGKETEAIYQIFNDTYMCLTLGSVFTNIILEKKGMAERDNAIFKIYRWELSKGGEVPEDLKDYLYMTMILTDRDKSGDLRRKRIQADYGYYYYVEETPWSWAYESAVDPGSSNMRKIDKEAASDPSKRTFTFTNTPKSDTPPHAESVKINEMPGK